MTGTHASRASRARSGKGAVCVGLLSLVTVLSACLSNEVEDSGAAVFVEVTPNFATVRQGRSVVVRVDLAYVPAGVSIAGFATDLPETESDIAITTAPCPSGAGTAFCEDWMIVPGALSTPGYYAATVRTSGSTLPVEHNELALRVLEARAPGIPPAVQVDSGWGYGFETPRPGSLEIPEESAHALFITGDRQLWGYGENASGQVRVGYLRIGTDATVTSAQPFFIDTPVLIQPSQTWFGVAAYGGNRSGSFALRADGTVWKWSRHEGNSTSSSDDLWQTVQMFPGLDRVTFFGISATNDGAWLARDSVGRVYGGGDPRPVLVAIANTPLSGVLAIAGGTYPPDAFQRFATTPDHGNGYVLKLDGTVARIYENYSRTGPSADQDGGSRFLYAGDMVDPGWNRITAVAAGRHHFLALREGKVLTAGSNAFGQTGIGSRVDPFTVTDGCNVACRDLVYTSPPVEVVGLTSVEAIAAKMDRSFALLADGTVWTWVADVLEPVQVQNLNSVRTIGPGYAIRDDCGDSGGTLWAIRFPAGASPTAERVRGVGDFTIRCEIESFELRSDSSSLSLMAAGDEERATVTLARSGYTGDVDLTIVDCPAGVTCVADPDPILGRSNSAVLTVSTISASSGNYVITVRGTGGGITSDLLLELRIQ